MNKFRLLKAEEIECRVQKCTAKGVTVLLYKTARTDADLLDETVGTDKWTNDFKIVGGVLYGGIGVDYGSGINWKWDAGTESNTEAEKGRASDAFKRAGFKHGIGRELYSAPFVFIPAEKCNIKAGNAGKYSCYDNFEVSKIEYENSKIKSLEISLDGKPVYVFPKGGKAEKKEELKPLPTDIRFKCENCGKVLTPYIGNNGTEVSIRKHAEGSKAKFGKVLCLDCIKNEN